VAQLWSLGVEHVFGTGGHTVVPVLDALGRSPIRFVMSRHELTAAHAADGYARTSGKPGVVLTGAGAGMLNAVSGVATATADGVPIVMISGDVPWRYADRSTGYPPVVKRAWYLRQATDLPRLVERAFWTAGSGRPGAVLLNVPTDLFARRLAPRLADRHPPVRHAAPSDLHRALADRIVAALADAQRPLVHVGGVLGDETAADALLSLAEQLDLPIGYSPLGKGFLPDDHPLVVGLTDPNHPLGEREGGEAGSRQWRGFEADAVLALDVDRVSLLRDGGSSVELDAVADPGLAIGTMTRAAREAASGRVVRPGLPERIRAVRRTVFAGGDQYPMRLLNELRTALPPGAVLVVDGGRHALAVARYYQVPANGGFLMPGRPWTIGFAPAAAIGAQLARRDRVVVALTDADGMSAQLPAVPMAVEQGLPVLFVVMVDRAGGPCDFAAIARACGAEGYAVCDPAELGRAVRVAVRERRPVVVEVPVEAPATGDVAGGAAAAGELAAGGPPAHVR
jgi:acetolactate synthase-1/2/3 large subunit